MGDRKVFDELFRRYYPILCAYGCRFVSLENAEEIAQDTLLWLWEHREEEIIQESIIKYMLKMIYNKSLNRIEQEHAKINAETSFYEEIIEGVLEDSDFCSINELTHKLNEAIYNLPENFREAFIMHRFKGKTYKQIAEELNITVKSVDYRIQQAVKILSIELKDYLPLITFLIVGKA